MALRQAIKISRALLPHKHKLQRSVCPLYTKPSKLFQLNSLSFKKASSYSDNVAPKVKKVTKETSDDVKEPEVLEQNVAFESWLEPVEEKTVKKEFVKSSTQNAITMPLKIPRLANPFPEPVICQRSHTVSDAEKARIMLEEVKMETKYGLLHQQQTIKRQNLKPTNYSQQAKSPSTPQDIIQKDSRRSQHCDQNPKHHQNDLGRQPNYRRAKNYEELQDEKQSCNQIQNELSQISHQKTTAEQNRNDTELNDEQIKKRRRKATKSRAPRYLRNFWKQKDQQTRKYSTSSKYLQNVPDAMSQVEQCEKILERIKAMYPESYGHLRKPFCLPGSPEEQEFIKNTLLLSRRTNERNQIEEVYRPSAPVPSYSEVKTLVRKPKTPLESIYNLSNRNSEDASRNYSTRIENNDRYNFLERNKNSVSFDSEIMSNQDNIYDIQERKNDEYRMPTPYRSYSECVDSAEDLEEEVMECEENTRETQHEEDKTHNRKRDLLFDKRRGKDDIKNRSYSTYTTYTTKNQVPVHVNYLKHKYSTLFKQPARNRKNNYSTNMDVLNNKPNKLGSYKDKNEEIEFIKKKAPCENPYNDLPICDYEKARKIRDDKRNNRRNNATKKKKCSATGKESDVESLESSSEVSQEKTKNVIKRIRKWLSSWRPESENIRVSKFYTDIEGRDTYIIQIDEYEEQERQRKETMELKHEEKMKSYNVPPDFMEKEIVTKKCEPVQQPDKIEQKPIVKENKVERRISPTAIINKINKITKKKESESFRINDREFIPEPINNSYMVNTDFNNQIKVLSEPVDSPLYLEKNKKKNPCSRLKKEPKKKKCRQEIKKKLPSCNNVKQEKLDDRSESIPPLATKNRSRTKQLMKKFSFTHSNSKKEANIDIKPQEIGHIDHEITQNNTKNRDAPFKLKQEFWK